VHIQAQANAHSQPVQKKLDDDDGLFDDFDDEEDF